MSRLIEFRGLATNGEFVYGSLVNNCAGLPNGVGQNTKTWIVTSAFGNGGWFNIRCRQYVRPETVGQFTGLLDCKGAKIFEGDRVSFFDTDDDEFMMCGVIKFGVRGYPAFDIYDDKNAPYSDDYNTLTNDEDFRFLVIGNIHQNSELLK